MTLNRQLKVKVTSENNILVEVIKVYMRTKYSDYTDHHNIE